MTSPFWMNDPNILLKKDKIAEIWPSNKMSFNDKLNAITRLVILLTILGMFFENRTQLAITGIVTIMCIALLHNFNSSKREGFADGKLNKLLNGTVTEPTEVNPLMNVLPTDIKDNPNRNPAAQSFNTEVEKKINNDTQDFIAKNFDDPTIKDKLFQDLGDKFTFDRSMRQWYSTPNTQIPNDQASFADWCYGDMVSCKEGHELACTRSAPHRVVGI